MKMRLFGVIFKHCGDYFCHQRNVVVLVQNDKGSGIKDAIITVDSTDETTTTNADGKMTLSNAYKLKKTITIKATYNNKDEEKSITIVDNDGKDNEVTFTFNGKCRI